MSKLLTPRNALIVGGVGAAFYLFPRSISKVNPVQNGIETSGSANIANRFSAAGATQTHTPATATPRTTSGVKYDHESQGGVTSPQFKDRIADQKPDTEGVTGKAWNKSMLGTDKGK